jgi:hypothetical protein
MRLSSPARQLQNYRFKPREALLALGVVLLLGGCGQVTHAGSASLTATQAATPATTPATTQAQSTGNSTLANGCPSKQIPVDSGLFRPDVTVTYSQDQGVAQPVALTHGQRLEIQLSPNVQWSLTVADPNRVLEGMTPEGWYDASVNACLWRFAAISAGSVYLSFRGSILCLSNLHCTAVSEQAAFEVTIQ